MIIGLEAALPEEQQPDKWQGNGNEQPAEFIGVGLHLVEHQAGVFAPFLNQPVVQKGQSCVFNIQISVRGIAF